MNMKKHQSQLCVEISSMIQIGEKEIIQKIFATDLYIYMEIADKQFIYLPDKGQYFIDKIRNQLKKTDMSVQIGQFKQIKQMIGELFIQETFTEHDDRHIQIKNSDLSSIHLKIEVDIMTFKRLEETVFHSFGLFQSETQPTFIQLQSNEVIKSLHTIFTISGQTQESTTKLIDIKILENPDVYDYYLEWEITS